MIKSTGFTLYRNPSPLPVQEKTTKTPQSDVYSDLFFPASDDDALQAHGSHEPPEGAGVA